MNWDPNFNLPAVTRNNFFVFHFTKMEKSLMLLACKGSNPVPTLSDQCANHYTTETKKLFFQSQCTKIPALFH